MPTAVSSIPLQKKPILRQPTSSAKAVNNLQNLTWTHAENQNGAEEHEARVSGIGTGDGRKSSAHYHPNLSVRSDLNKKEFEKTKLPLFPFFSLLGKYYPKRVALAFSLTPIRTDQLLDDGGE